MSDAYPNTDPAASRPQAAPVTDACDVVLILSNAPDLMLAKRIAHILVEEHYAACVNLGPAGLSMYMWQGTLEGADEIPITIKTTAAQAPAVMDKLAQLHPYEVPEMLVVPAVGGSASYIEWVRTQVAHGEA